jgi:hypothetical protein
MALLRFRWVVALIVALIVVVGVYAADYALNSAGPVGDRGRAILNGPFLGVQFEIDHMQGMKPDSGALDRLSGFVLEHTGKLVLYSQSEIQSYAGPATGGSTYPCLLPPCPTNSYTLDQIVAITMRERNVLPPPGVISVYILYADRPSSEGEQVGAAAYCATCIVVFEPGARSDTVVQAIVLGHEFGHLLGVCALSYTDVREHCDGAGHSTNPHDLMYYRPDLQDPGVQALKLDANDLADLRDLRAGTL